MADTTPTEPNPPHPSPVTSSSPPTEDPQVTNALVESLIKSNSPSVTTTTTTTTTDTPMSGGTIIPPTIDASQPPSKKKSGKKGILIAFILLLLLSIPLLVYYVAQPKELADLRSKAADPYDSCPTTSNQECVPTANSCLFVGGIPVGQCQPSGVCCFFPTLPTPSTAAPTPTPLNTCSSSWDCITKTISSCNSNGNCPSDQYSEEEQICTDSLGIEHVCNKGCHLDDSCDTTPSPSPAFTGVVTVCYWVPDNSCGRSCPCNKIQTAIEYCDNGTGPIEFGHRCSDITASCTCIGPSPTEKPNNNPTNTPPPGATITPTPTPQACQAIRIYKNDGTGNYVDITAALQNGTSGVVPGDTIRIGVLGPANATAARVRVQVGTVMSAWSADITTKNTAGYFIYDYIITSFNSFLVEAETKVGTIWK